MALATTARRLARPIPAGLILSLSLLAPASAAPADYRFQPVVESPAGVRWNGPGRPVINNAGDVAFPGYVPAAAPGENPTGNGIYVSHNGTVTRVFQDDASRFERLAINGRGEVGFYSVAFNSGGANTVESIYRAAVGAQPTRIADDTGPYDHFNGLVPVMIDEAGKVSFSALLKNDGRTGLFNGPDPVANKIVDEIAPTGFPTLQFIRPDGTVLFRGVNSGGPNGIYKGPDVVADRVYDFAHLNNPIGYSENSRGQRAYTAYLIGDNPPASTVQYIFTGADPGTGPFADTAGPFQQFLSAPNLNEDGTIVFAASLDAGGAGIFSGPDALADRIVAIGDPLFGSTVTRVFFDPGLGGLNDAGQVAFAYQLADGRTGVAVASPVPEPAGLLILLASAPALLTRRPRR